MIKSILKRLPKVEMKYFDSELLVQPSNTGLTANTGNIVQGTGAFDRIGRVINLKHISARALITKDSLASSSSIRFLLCYEKVPDGINPTIAHVLKNPAVNALRNLNETKQIRVLYDRTYTLNDNMPSRLIKINKKLNHQRRYGATATSGAFSDVEIGNLFWCIITDNASNYSTVDMDFRLRYTDG